MYGSLVSSRVMLVMFHFISIFTTIIAGQTAAEACIQLVCFAPGVGAGSLIYVWMTPKLRQVCPFIRPWITRRNSRPRTVQYSGECESQ